MKEELLKCEQEKIFAEIPLLDYIYIIPTRRNHSSGYKCMEIIGENENGYKKKLATFSDVIDLEDVINCPSSVLSMDIPEYGVLRFFSHIGKFKIWYYGVSTFSFEIIRKEKHNETTI